MFKFKFDKHLEVKPVIMNYLVSEECEYPVNFNGLCITKPNLHQKKQFKEIKEFFEICLQQSMTALGYYPNQQITSMWATKHENDGAHHKHQHENTFLVGVYYLHGNERSSGTILYNPLKLLINYIMPKKLPDNDSQKRIMNTNTINNFEEGTFIVFPSWIEHSTNNNNIESTKSERYILGVNSMPLGSTNRDPYNRFNYQDISNIENW